MGSEGIAFTTNQNLTKSGSKMETSKQLNIFQFFQKTPNSENQVGGFNRKEEEDRPTTSNVSHGGKRSRDGDMDCAETNKKRRRDFVRQYDVHGTWFHHCS